MGYRRGCESPQYLEIGKAETILCSFKEDFDSINWYFNLDVTDGPPTVSYENQIVRGEGVETGEFDIREDGSLIINNVSIKHETRFTVYEVETADHLPIRHDVDIVTIGKYIIILSFFWLCVFNILYLYSPTQMFVRTILTGKYRSALCSLLLNFYFDIFGKVNS